MKERWTRVKYVVILAEKDRGNPEVQCCFCDKEFVGVRY